MFGHVETAFAATCAEQHLASLRATKLGPLLVEAERKPTTISIDAGPVLTRMVGRTVHHLRSTRLKWARRAAELGLIGGQ